MEGFMTSTRRTFLGGTAAALAVSGAQADPAYPTTGLKIGIASYSLRKFTRAQAIDMIRRLGMKYVSVKSFHLPYESTPEEIRAARAEFEAAGLTILSGGNVPFDKPDQADIRRKFEYAKMAGMAELVCAPTHETLPLLEPFVREYDIRLAIHNHGPEDKQFPTPQSVRDAVKGMDARIGLCIDVGHTVRAGADPVSSAQEAGARLFDMHIKDLIRQSSDENCPVGDGIIPVTAIFKQLNRMGYARSVMLEYEADPDAPFAPMMKSIGYERGVLAGLHG
jgi:sugar phosphate isomerase/epimerase